MAYIGNAPVSGEFKKLTDIQSSFNGVTNSFPLTSSGAAIFPATAQNLLISVGGVVLEPGVGYGVSGSTITFAVAPIASAKFFGVLLGSFGPATTVSDGAVTTAKLGGLSVTESKLGLLAVTTPTIAALAVTGAKIANATITGDKLVGTTVTSDKLASGVAVANLGFTPEPAITTLPVTKGGTGATTGAQAQINIGIKTSATGSLAGAAGTSAQRDGAPVLGYTRFNTTLGASEVWNGSAWVQMGYGVTGAAGNPAFVETDQVISGSYTLTSGKNAMSAGPVTINNGVVVTIPTGATWSIV